MRFSRSSSLSVIAVILRSRNSGVRKVQRHPHDRVAYARPMRGPACGLASLCLAEAMEQLRQRSSPPGTVGSRSDVDFAFCCEVVFMWWLSVAAPKGRKNYVENAGRQSSPDRTGMEAFQDWPRPA